MLATVKFNGRPERIQIAQAGRLEHAEARRIEGELLDKAMLTRRDRQMMWWLRELRVLSIDQIRRLMWSGSTRKTVYNRLLDLSKHYVVGPSYTPRQDMQASGLHPSRVYGLGQVGRLLVKDFDTTGDNFVARYLKLDQTVHDLMVSELFTRMTEQTFQRGEGWRFSVFGERAASYYPPRSEAPLVAPDGLGVLVRIVEGEVITLPFFVEMDASREAHGAVSSDWGRKIVGYDRFYESKWRTEHPVLRRLNPKNFPVVLVITHGKRRMTNLAQAIIKKRQQGVVYYLARWKEDILPAADIFSAPVWMFINSKGELVGVDPDERKPLITAATGKKKAT